MITAPNPYIPSFLRASMSGSRPLTLTWSQVADTNIQSTSSFQYDPPSTPLKSTQQLNVDWSQFQNHTFFMSAEANVNLAFNAVINGFPFDGTRQETEFFFDNLTGFQKWIFDNFPTYRGELLFSGTQVGETSPTAGTYIAVQNKVGGLFPDLSSQAITGEPVLNPTGSQSMTIEMQLYLPPIANDVQTICQMLSGTVGGPATQGFSFYLTQSASPSSVDGYFSVVSGSSNMTVHVGLTKGIFNHVAVTLDRDSGLPYLESFLLSTPVSESPTQVEMGDLAIDGSQFLIGSGTQLLVGSQLVTPVQTLSGTIDEFRVFHSARTPAQQAAYAAKALYATSDLVLYFRFNEPAPPLTLSPTDPINGIVLDSSGNALHTLISNFTGSLRLDSSADPLNPILYERPDSVPVLFPAYPPTVAFNLELLASASTYDQENPNLITRLVPQHYLLEGAAQDGFTDPITGNDAQPFGGSGIPGQGQMGNVQILVSLLYIWAQFFDDIKLFVDSFSTLRTVDYNTDETVPDSFLLDMVKNLGFYLPPMFNDSTLEQYIRGENVDLQSITTNSTALRQVQNTLLRRVLVNLPDVLKSKGTQHSIKSFLRAVGIDPGNNVRIREFGGPTTRNLTYSRETKLEPGTMVEFSGSNIVVVSPFLSASRTEPGYPQPQGQFVQQNKYPPLGISNDPSDGLLTSGSWTWEGLVKYTPLLIDQFQTATQSLVRMCVTGSVAGDSAGSAGLVANLLAISSSVQPKLVLYMRPGDAPTSPLLRLELDTPVPGYTDVDDMPPGMFNHDRWNVSFGCQRNDDGLGSVVSSSYFLRLAYQNDGKIVYSQVTASLFEEAPRGENNVLRTLNTASNASGSFFVVGPGQFIASGQSSQYLHLNNTSSSIGVPEEALTTAFYGLMSNFRFWSRGLTVSEWEEHVRNYNSIGVEDPLINWNYVHTQTGSFGHLRLNSMLTQQNRQAVATASLGAPTGSFLFFDFSENGFHLTGSQFPINVDILAGEIFDYSYLSPYFDEATCDDKVRIRSYQDFSLVEHTPWASLAPVYALDPSEQPTDDVRFIIEFSLIDALNRDMITMFATLDALDNAMGAPELVFSPDYPDLELLSDVYFNRIKGKLNFQAFFEFFRWFDTSIGTFILQLIPRKTRFKGTNFTIESHMFERAKQEYQYSDMYLGDSNRANLDAQILLQLIEGTCRKF